MRNRSSHRWMECSEYYASADEVHQHVQKVKQWAEEVAKRVKHSSESIKGVIERLMSLHKVRLQEKFRF